jgi:glycosyltransferase involved in cell wall biosynthesis
MANSNPDVLSVKEAPEPALSGQRAWPSICVVGPGWRFTSGISYYTCRLVKAAAQDYSVSVIQLRQLLPRFLYPGRRRVGQPRARMAYPPDVPVYDGVNWWWGASLLRAVSFIRSNRPKVLVLQWWTATALHTYLMLAMMARFLGARVVIEMHETQDPDEARYPVIRHYCRWGLRLLLRLCHGCVVHSIGDFRSLEKDYKTERLRLTVARHGPYDQYNLAEESFSDEDPAIAAVKRAPRPGAVNLLFFGLIRPYKGLEDLLAVFNGLSERETAGLWLTIVGETWGGYSEPKRLVEESPHRDRITFVNEYVPDEVVRTAFSHADVVVLPYHRSSGSGTLHVAMNWGLPVVVSNVGGLPHAAGDYGGAIFVPPRDREALKAGIEDAVKMAGQRFTDPRDWGEVIDALVYAADVEPCGQEQ